MRNVSEKMYRKSKHTFYAPIFFSENCADYETIWRNVVEPEATEENIICSMRSA